MCKLGIVADDLTGATTVGVLLARAGISAAAFFDEKSLDSDAEHKALVISTDSRALKKEEAQPKVKSAVRALKEKGAVYFSKRVDTTLRGGIGYEVDAMLEELAPDTMAVVVPSMPQSKRIVVGGYSIIDGTALSKTPVAQDVRTPVTESYVPALMAQQTEHPIGFVPLSALLAGKESVKQCLQQEREKGAKYIIADAITTEDVEMIAEAVTKLEWNVLAVDPGPFTEKLAIAKGFKAESHELSSGGISESEMNGMVLVVAGSATPVTKVQMKTLSEKNWASKVPVSAKDLIDVTKTAPSEIGRAAAATLKMIQSRKHNVVLLETSLTGDVLNLAEKEKELGLAPGEAAGNINKGLGGIVAQVLSEELDYIKGIYMTGGDTMVNVLQVLGAKGIELVDYVIPQADLGRIIGGKFDGLVVVGKGGLTGSNDTAVSIVKRIFEESASPCPGAITV
ncbi:four-carbon acid sugar kinase family protein [Neobacillus mesonae]|uniref:four-carbon acid sugar kinase family protein n=1 Tax=Neobacillus mesonae TaxID=1193713 RepID=UPI00203AA51D|nr:four-carbon acid sugar kinase family protein [Neobacillus mesonae]MCM3567343.1 four-carbon acid sugar kinase family protein [Neobacillus mesonae]